MGQGARSLGPPPVRHQPARDRDGDGDQRKQRRDHQRDDEPNLGHAHVLVPAEAGLRVDAGLCPPLDGEDGVGLDLDLLPQLAGVHLGLLAPGLSLSLLAAVGVAAGAVLRLALAEADADVALEPDVVAARELEGVEHGGEHAALPLVLPLPEDAGVRGAAVFIGDQVLVLSVVVHGVRHATPGEAPVNCIRLDIYLEHERITDLSSGNVFSI